MAMGGNDGVIVKVMGVDMYRNPANDTADRHVLNID